MIKISKFHRIKYTHLTKQFLSNSKVKTYCQNCKLLVPIKLNKLYNSKHIFFEPSNRVEQIHWVF